MDKNMKQAFWIQEIGYQVTKDSNPWKMRNKIRKLYKCPSFNYFENFQGIAWGWKIEPGRFPELSTWKWEFGETKALKTHRTDNQRESGTRRELQRSVEGPTWVLNWGIEDTKKTQIKNRLMLTWRMWQEKLF